LTALDYEKLMESLFDFDRIHKLLTSEISDAWIQCRGNRSHAHALLKAFGAPADL